MFLILISQNKINRYCKTKSRLQGRVCVLGLPTCTWHFSSFSLLLFLSIPSFFIPVTLFISISSHLLPFFTSLVLLSASLSVRGFLFYLFRLWREPTWSLSQRYLPPLTSDRDFHPFIEV